ncbi:DUF2789 family protein [Roseateles koreensis]|uniref:DUF2789 family protein n=1 Tax=Roseateles koreensis TaxID=2987526 RepID=A0ABT5KLR8_9BURK|nr:DUF2789 family protein [Roseateles koreensis]MDC8783854.1 DUF2789 family protein [Roseateles koreensis]
MNSPYHRFSELFAQLGLPSNDEAIRRFIAEHAPLAGEIKLEDAAFWTAAQAQLLRETIIDDADWADVVDHLNAALRSVL